MVKETTEEWLKEGGMTWFDWFYVQILSEIGILVFLIGIFDRTLVDNSILPDILPDKYWPVVIMAGMFIWVADTLLVHPLLRFIKWIRCG